MSGDQVFWHVALRENDGRELFSEEGSFEIGLLDRSDWSAVCVGLPAPVHAHDDYRPCPHLRRIFSLGGAVKRARLHITSAGLAEPWLNGQRVSDRLFRPGWTDYRKRLLVDTYDVTDLLVPGENCLGAILGEGWFAGAIGFEGRRNVYGKQTGLLAQLEACLENGEIVCIVTDSEWTGRFGPILASDRYSGEVFDARWELDNWCLPESSCEAWRPCSEVPLPAGSLVPSPGPFVRVQKMLAPSCISTTENGDIRVDLAKSITGWAKLEFAAPYGRIVNLAFAEARRIDGSLETGTLGNARCRDTVTVGSSLLEWQPHFTYRGFRHFDISGLDGEHQLKRVLGVSAHSDVEEIGQFSCSDPVMNSYFDMARRTLKMNLFDIFTDCPQRNERLGWLGDAAQFMPSACKMLEMAPFLEKWIGDILDAQDKDGVFPPQAPAYEQPPPPFRTVSPDLTGLGRAVSDGAVLIPWTTYEHAGDLRLLENVFPAALHFVRHSLNAAPDYIWHPEDTSLLNIDWLARDEGTDPSLLCTAYLSQTIDRVARMAAALGHDATAELCDHRVKAKQAFAGEFINSNGLVGTGSQTSFALAISMGLVPQEKSDSVCRQFARVVEQEGQFTSGIYGIAHILPALTQIGRADLAYSLFQSQSRPGFAYWQRSGLTTIPELWDPFDDDGELKSDWGNSLCHVALGSCTDWLFSSVAGLAPDAPGWRRLRFAPRPGGKLEHASASVRTPYGTARCGWHLNSRSLEVELLVPPNCSGNLHWNGEVHRIEAGATVLSLSNGG
ncbi:family 78 glycoside hydrolase catalytic domain [Tsuneonella dongtanensis]|uniref:family 78 glycoside hydrolase catalytic domain n=1 Tax=Tsuneonella dongtanensis TaxID=692370 RepID=UPI0018DBCD12|nr:family 78 glycoside hydrolase catalytic domain [Tsuneonella dongtanensis]